ncbi:MAG: hypothetical protein ACLUOI_07585 [Eisenbergiella sp.]
MKNVHDRIRLLYGEEYGIRVTSTVSGNNGAVADAGYGEGGTDGW